MERTQLFDLMGELKLYGMKAAFDEIIVKSHPTPTPFRVQSRPPQVGLEWAYPCSA